MVKSVTVETLLKKGFIKKTSRIPIRCVKDLKKIKKSELILVTPKRLKDGGFIKK